MNCAVARLWGRIARRSSALYALVLSMMLAPTAALAWGADGHRITGHIATAWLTEGTRSALEEHFGSADLSLIANYMDQNLAKLEAEYPGSRGWHYNNRPICARRDAFESYCGDGHYATKQIFCWHQLLQDEHVSDEDKRLAVRVIVHVVGDMHQPLHMADNGDRGGNNVYIRVPGESHRIKLHKAWDTTFVADVRGSLSDKQYAAALVRKYESRRAKWQSGRIRDWAAESAALAKAHAYRLDGFACNWDDKPTVSVDAEYVKSATTLIPEQLAKAGARIAWLLNSALDESSP